MQLFFIVSGPQDCTVQNTAVFKAVRQTADINAAAFAELVDGHLYFFLALHENLSTLKGIDRLFALAEIDLFRGVGQDKMIFVLIPVVLVVVEREAGFFLYAHHAGQLQVTALVLVASRLTNADEAAAIVYECFHGAGDFSILPNSTAGVCGIAVAHVDDDINLVQNRRILFDVVKADELHIKRSAGQRFDNACIAVILLLIQCMVYHVATPAAALTPAVQNSHGLDAIRCGALDVFIQHAELVANALDVINKLGEFQSQLQVAAVSDTVNRLTQNCAASSYPVLLALFHRVAALVEGIGEEVRQEAALGVFYAGDIADQTQGGTVAHAAYDSIQTDGFELVHKRLGADEVVAEEHHGLFAQLMGDVYHLFGQLCYLTALEGHKVFKLFRRYTILVVVVALVNDELGAEFVADFLLKLLQNVRRNGSRIAVPVYIFFALELVEHQGELMEERGVANHVDIGMIGNKLAQTLHRELVGFRLTHVERNLMLKVLPVIGHRIVHMHGVPNQVSQEADGIIVELLRLGNFDTAGLFVVAPCVGGDNFTCCTVDNFPPAFDVVAGVHFHQLVGNALHQGNLQLTAGCRIETGHDVALLHLIRVCLCPCVILTGSVIGRINLSAYLCQLLGELGSVAVADCVSAPALQNINGFGNDIEVGRNGYATFGQIAHCGYSFIF